LIENTLIGLIPLTTLIFSFTMPILHYVVKGSRRVIELTSLIASLIPLIMSIELVKLAFSTDEIIVYRFGGWPPPVGIVYMLDKLNSLLVFTTTFLMFLITIYSNKYLAEDKSLAWYYTLYFGLETGLLGVLLTGDVFNLFVMIEVTSVASYSLVMFYRHRGDSIASGLKYAFIGSLGTTIYFFALGLIYATFGTFNYFDLTAKTHGYTYPYSGQPIGDVLFTTGIVLVLITWTFTIKAGVFPNHFWLPDAHPAAPTPISAILSGLVVNVGAYAMFRYIYTIYGGNLLNIELNNIVNIVSNILLNIGLISAIIGSILMNFQRDVKRIIAYSTVMHLGYLFMCIGARNNYGIESFILHIINHSIAKATLFLSTGVFIYTTGSRLLEKLGGLASKHILATLATILSALNLAGIPPLPIFYSKLLLFYATFDISIAYGIKIILTSAIALIAYVKIIYTLIFGRIYVTDLKKTPLAMNITLLSLLIVMILITFGINIIIADFIEKTALQISSIENYMLKP